MATLKLAWAGGSYAQNVFHLVVGKNPQSVNQGVLVHVSEPQLQEATTSTPWIAFISCDSNSTDASNDTDIFAEARERGAAAVLLYSLLSEHCLLLPEYTSSDSHPIDIFAAPQTSSSIIIEAEYQTANVTQLRDFNASVLNDVGPTISHTLSSNGSVDVPPHMILATISTDISGSSPSQGGSETASSSSGAFRPHIQSNIYLGAGLAAGIFAILS
ncbi:hypothetical protein BDW22DRAFT_1357959 [Trametopsis cervina]|nr:hypothetical protein BDW22DRAFT_1357959 [Trametopsis cervina]